MLISLLVFRLNHGQLQELGADLQPGGSGHLRIDPKAHALSFHEEGNDASALGKPIELTYCQDASGVSGFDDLSEAAGLRRAHKQDMTSSNRSDVADTANDERATIYRLAIDDAVEGASERIPTQHA